MNKTYSTELKESIKEKIYQSNSKVIHSSFVSSDPEEVIKEMLFPQPSEQEASQLIHYGKITTENSSPLSDELWEVIVQDFKDELGYEDQPFMAFQTPEEGSNHINFFWVKFDWTGKSLHQDLNPQKIESVLETIKDRYETPRLMLKKEADDEEQK